MSETETPQVQSYEEMMRLAAEVERGVNAQVLPWLTAHFPQHTTLWNMQIRFTGRYDIIVVAEFHDRVRYNLFTVQTSVGVGDVVPPEDGLATDAMLDRLFAVYSALGWSVAGTLVPTCILPTDPAVDAAVLRAAWEDTEFLATSWHAQQATAVTPLPDLPTWGENEIFPA